MLYDQYNKPSYSFYSILYAALGVSFFLYLNIMKIHFNQTHYLILFCLAYTLILVLLSALLRYSNCKKYDAITVFYEFARRTFPLAVVFKGFYLKFSTDSTFLSAARTVSLDTNFFNFPLQFSLDPMSYYFILLTTLTVVCCCTYLEIKYAEAGNLNEYYENSLFINIMFFFLMIFFTTTNILLMYISYEAVLIPMFLLMGMKGSRERKIRAAYLFFYYTLCCSLPMLVAILYIYNRTGSFELEWIKLSLEFGLTGQFTNLEKSLLNICFLLAFAAKIPMFPFHIWLPEAHVEAPTVGSVMLASVLLKLGIYGMIRINIGLFWPSCVEILPLVSFAAACGLLHASFAAIRQTDIKRIVAYSSIAHMNLIVLALFSNTSLGIESGILQSLNHGYVAGGLFFLIGMVYDRYHTREIHYYGGLAHVMPMFAGYFLLFTMANIALPGSGNFIGEFLLLTALFKKLSYFAVILALGVILSGAYALWLCNRTIYGNLKNNYLLKAKDLTRGEITILAELAIYIIVIGIYSETILGYFHNSGLFPYLLGC